jgi:hypothetical protein
MKFDKVGFQRKTVPEDLKERLKSMEKIADVEETPEGWAKVLAYLCVRNNTIIEDIHAGESMPDKYYADGAMYSRITGEEMKKFMMEVTANLVVALSNPETMKMLCEYTLWKVPDYWEAADYSSLNPIDGKVP